MKKVASGAYKLTVVRNDGLEKKSECQPEDWGLDFVGTYRLCSIRLSGMEVHGNSSLPDLSDW